MHDQRFLRDFDVGTFHDDDDSDYITMHVDGQQYVLPENVARRLEARLGQKLDLLDEMQ